MRPTIQKLLAMMLALQLLGASRGHSESERKAELEMTESGLTLIDGSSSYTFSKDGSFSSRPLDSICGRTFTGKWVRIDERVEVTAEEGWVNGIHSPSYRRIVFIIGSGKSVPYIMPDDPTGKLAIVLQNPKTYFKCYWLIDEMTKIQAPLKTEAEQVVPPNGP
jgi:hypothetical protein